MAYSPIDPTVLTGVLNNQGTQATSAKQDTQIALEQNGNAIATVVMNDMGTLATSANQTTEIAALSALVNSQGTVHRVTLWGTGTHAGTNFVFQEVTVNDGRMQVDVKPSDSSAIDAFSRQRVSNPGYRFDGQFIYQFNTDTWDSASTSGSIAYDAVNRLVTLANDAGTNVSVLQSHYHAPYTPGRSQLVFATFNMKVAPTTGVTKRVGYFDGNNGIFLEWDATNGVSVNIASNTLNGNQQVTQNNWNIDRLQGLGPSGFTLDLTKTQIFFVSFQALYTGRVTIGFDIDGQLIPVHAFTHANKVLYPYIQQASQPIRYEVRGTNATGANMDCICASVISEGGVDLLQLPGRAFSVAVATGTAIPSTRTPMLSVRPKQVLNNVRNQGLVLPQQITVNCATNPAVVQLIRNGTVSPSVWSDVDANSMAEYSVSATTITGGQTVYSCMVGKDAAGVFPINGDALGRIIGAYSHLLPTNPADMFTLVVNSLNANATTSLGLNWKEIR